MALARLPVDQREALLLVSASDMSYEEAAVICGVAVGTIKSRVNRARARLAELLHLQRGLRIRPRAGREGRPHVQDGLLIRQTRPGMTRALFASDVGSVYIFTSVL